MEDEHTKEPSHNNPEEAADNVKAVNLLLQSFVNDIRGFNHYKRQDAYKTFLHTLSQLLSKLDSTYFTNMDTEVVLDTIPDKVCAAFLAHPEEAADKVQQRVSSDSIPTGPEVTSKMRLQGNIPQQESSPTTQNSSIFWMQKDPNFGNAMIIRHLGPENCQNLTQKDTNFRNAIIIHHLGPEKTPKILPRKTQILGTP